MAKITKNQIETINNKCSNNWRLDVQYLLFHNEKQLIKHIRLDEEHYLKFSLYYNYQNQIQLHISKFYHKVGDTFASSTGLGKHKILNEAKATRKSINNLIELTKQLNDDKLTQINAETEVTKSSMFVASESF